MGGMSGKGWLASNNLKAPRRKEDDRAQVRRMSKKIWRGRQGRPLWRDQQTNHAGDSPGLYSLLFCQA